MGPRWRLMVLLGAFASLRPEELAELRRRSVDVDECSLRITQASPELTNGKRVTGDPKTRAGKRTVYLPDFLLPELRRHLQWFAEKERDGLLFVGEKGAPFRRSTFGRKWRKARETTPGSMTWGFEMERVTRIELALSAWEAVGIPGLFGR